MYKRIASGACVVDFEYGFVTVFPAASLFASAAEFARTSFIVPKEQHQWALEATRVQRVGACVDKSDFLMISNFLSDRLCGQKADSFPGILFDQKGSVYGIDLEKFNDTVTRIGARNTRAQILGSAAFAGFVGGIAGLTLPSNGSLEELFVSLSKLEPLPSSMVFIIFLAFFMAPSVGLVQHAKMLYLNAEPDERVLTRPQEIGPRVPILGCVDEKQFLGYLDRTQFGLLTISNLDDLLPSARQLLADVLSSGGTYRSTKSGSTCFVPYTGTILVVTPKGGFNDPLLEARLMNLSILPAKKSHPHDVVEDSGSTDLYDRQNLSEILKMVEVNPFALLVGFEQEIILVKERVNNWLNEWDTWRPGKALPPNLTFVLADSHPDCFGAAKSTFAEAISRYAKIQADQRGILFPGIQLERKGDLVETTLIQNVPTFGKTPSFYLNSTLAVLAIVLLGVEFGGVANRVRHETDVLTLIRWILFSSFCLIATAALQGVSVVYSESAHNGRSDEKPTILNRPGPLCEVQIPTTPDRFFLQGKPSEDASAPQRKFKSVDPNGGILATKAIGSVFVVESAALDQRASDSSQSTDDKNVFRSFISHAVTDNKISLGGEYPLPTSAILILTTNNRATLPDGVNESTVVEQIEFSGAVRLGSKIEDAKAQFATLIVAKNNAIRGCPWTDDAISFLFECIQFEGALNSGLNKPHNQIILLRSMFTELLANCSALARRLDDPSEQPRVNRSIAAEGWDLFMEEGTFASKQIKAIIAANSFAGEA